MSQWTKIEGLDSYPSSEGIFWSKSVLVWNGRSMYIDSFFHLKKGITSLSDPYSVHRKPTHWMPLPNPPGDDKNDKQK